MTTRYSEIAAWILEQRTPHYSSSLIHDHQLLQLLLNDIDCFIVVIIIAVKDLNSDSSYLGCHFYSHFMLESATASAGGLSVSHIIIFRHNSNRCSPEAKLCMLELVLTFGYCCCKGYIWICCI